MVTKQIFGIIFSFILLISLVSAIACSDSNEQDINDIPCEGLTNKISCSDNVSIINLNTSVQENLSTTAKGDGRFNFTFNFNESSYSLVDCANNTATIIVGNFEQGFGISIFTFIFPAFALSFICILISWRMGRFISNKDEEDIEEAEGRDLSFEDESIFRVGKINRAIPVAIILFSFIPMFFAIRFVSLNLERYLPGASATSFFGGFYIFFLWMFFVIFIVSMVILFASLIGKNPRSWFTHGN